MKHANADSSEAHPHWHQAGWIAYGKAYHRVLDPNQYPMDIQKQRPTPIQTAQKHQKEKTKKKKPAIEVAEIGEHNG